MSVLRLCTSSKGQSDEQKVRYDNQPQWVVTLNTSRYTTVKYDQQWEEAGNIQTGEQWTRYWLSTVSTQWLHVHQVWSAMGGGRQHTDWWAMDEILTKHSIDPVATCTPSMISNKISTEHNNSELSYWLNGLHPASLISEDGQCYKGLSKTLSTKYSDSWFGRATCTYIVHVGACRSVHQKLLCM